MVEEMDVSVASDVEDSPEAACSACCCVDENDGGEVSLSQPYQGVYVENRLPLSSEQQREHEVLASCLPDLDAASVADVVRFIARVRRRKPFASSVTDLNGFVEDRRRRQRDGDVKQRENHKWRTFRGRFQGLFVHKEGSFLTREQWKPLLDISAQYEHDYFYLFTHTYQCPGSWDGKPCPGGPSVVDFLDASSDERQFWHLDHLVEVHRIHGTWKELHDSGGKADLHLVAHLLFSVRPSAEYGPPNVILRCGYCDTSVRHTTIQVPDLKLKLQRSSFL